MPNNLTPRQRKQKDEIILMQSQREGILKTAVANYNKRQALQQDWDFNSKPKIGALCFKKRTFFWGQYQL